ncbi:MAG: hypothetical protein IJJ33_03960 [Victivallales bacterium]|nr:hypothetical protein [Victivallales bacterium]
MTGDFPGEAQFFYEEYLDGGEPYRIDGCPGTIELYYKDGVALCPVGQGKTTAAMNTAAKAGKVLLAAYNTLYAFDPAKMEVRQVKIKMPDSGSAVTELPDGTAAIYNMKMLYRYDGELHELPLPTDFKQKKTCHLGVSQDGKYLYFGDPLAAYDLSGGKVVQSIPEIGTVRWGYATDTRRNELNLAAWRRIIVLANADNPAKWREIGRLGSTDAAPIYTHRDVAPASCSGSLCYLPESDEMLFASRTGVTILGMKPHAGNLCGELKWERYVRDNDEIAGDTALHQALRRRKMIAAWVTTSHAVNADALANMKKSGINAVIHMVFQIDHGRFYPPHDVRQTILNTGKLCAEKDMTYILCITPYNISVNNSKQTFRRMILPDGTVAKYRSEPRNPQYTVTEFPCWLDREYSEKAGMRFNMVEFAKLAKEAGIVGVIFELGDGTTPTNIHGRNCLCDHCFQSYLASAGLGKEDVPANQRAKFLGKQKKYPDFVHWQQEELAKICAEANAAMREIAPEVCACVMLPETASDYTKDWRFTAFIKGFQRKGNPVPVFSEQTYALPYMPELCSKLDDKWASNGLETLLIPGQTNYWIPPAELAKRVRTYLKYTPGVYYYHNYQWYTERRGEPFYNPMDRMFHKGGYTLGDYMDLPNPLK